MRQEPKIILFDLETIPNLKEILKVWPGVGAYPGLTLKATITTIICAGYKIFGESKTHCINAWDFPKWEKDINNDKEVVKKIADIIKDADAVVTHNGKRFDWKFLQTRLMYHGLEPLPKIPHIDTKELSKRHLFAFNNRLNTIGKLLAKDKKLSHEGWNLWVKVCNKNKTAMKNMEKYCKQDVNLLEKVFKKLRPLISNIPNYNLFVTDYAGDKKVCPHCGGTRLKSKGWQHTKTNSYRRLYCLGCGAYSKDNKKENLPRSM